MQVLEHTWNRKTIWKLRVGQGTVVRGRSDRLDSKETTKGGKGSALLPVDRIATGRDRVTGIVDVLFDTG